MNKILIIAICFMFLTTPCLGLEILSPTQNTTYNKLNVSLIYTTNASRVEMVINDENPRFFTKNQTIEFDQDGDYYLTLTANETINNQTEEVTDSVFFTIYTVQVDYCEVAIDMLAKHNCTEGIDMEIIRHECIPTECEEMLHECQAEILPEVQSEYNNLRTKCVIQQEAIETCKAEPWQWAVAITGLLTFGLAGWFMWMRDNAL